MNIKLYDKNIKGYTLRESGLTFSLIALAFFVGNLICSIVLSLNGGNNNTTLTIINSLIIYACFFVVILISKFNKGYSFTNFYKPLNYKYLIISIIAVFSLMFGFEKLNGYIVELFEKIGIKTSVADLNITNSGELIGAIISIALVPAVIEEYLFRGVIQAGLHKGNIIIRCLICSILFMLFHGNIAQSGYQLLAGLTFSLIAIRSGTILWCTLAHFLNNAFVLICDYFNFGNELFNSNIIMIISIVIFIGCIVFMVLDKTEGNEYKNDEDNTTYKKFTLSGIFGILLYIGVVIINVVA